MRILRTREATKGRRMKVSCLFLAATLASMTMSGVVLAQRVEGASGKVAWLRVHDVGTKYGPPADQIDVEVVFGLDTKPGRAFGFQLRKDSNEAAREGMLALLRDAFKNNWTVGIDYTRVVNDITPDPKNSIAIRVWVNR